MKKTIISFSYLLFSLVIFGQTKSLVWSDEFNSSSINTSSWAYDLGNGDGGWGNQELQYYTSRSDNAKILDGNLVITAKKESYGGFNYTSARLVTRNKVSWKYGRIEVRANLPGGTGIWPAIWMLPEVWNYGNGSWPDNGEIDIMEYVGYKPGVVHGSLHNHNNSGSNSITQTINIADAEDDFHVYALEWSATKIEMFVDDTKYFTYNNPETGWEAWPWNKEFHLLINIAVGGSWGGAQGIDDAIFPQTMEIDYVRVYEMENSDEFFLENAKVDTSKLDINLDFNVEAASPLNEENSFVVLVNNVNPNAVHSVYLDPSNSKRIKINLADSIHFGDVVSLSYTPGNIQSISGVLLSAFQGKLVDNTITAIDQFQESFQSIAYPNPFNDFLDLKFKNKIKYIWVTDVYGNSIYKEQSSLETKEININTSEWKSGMYIIHLIPVSHKAYSLKVIKGN